MAEQQTPQRPPTLAQRIDIAASMALFPALTVMVFLRRKIGYRFLDPMRIFIMTMLLSILMGTDFLYLRHSPSLPSLFILAMIGCTVWQRRSRWKEIKQGIRWHSRSRGVSHFSFLPFNEWTIRRFVDPAACAAIGAIIPSPLGHYLVFSAVCLFVFEMWDFDQMISRTLDTLDSLIDSEVQAETVEYYDKGNNRPRTVEETSGIPTGIAPDIEAMIQQRKRQNTDADKHSGV